MNDNELFYPRIKRRSKYSLSKKGAYYRDYQKYRQEIREDCQGRCVYCDCHENDLGGSYMMHLDHFRPKGLPQFKHLLYNPNNLVWACSKCNNLKSDKWPAHQLDELTFGGEGFIEPFVDDRKEYFQIADNGELVPQKPPAEYLIILLALDRIALQKIREKRLLNFQMMTRIDEFLIEFARKPSLTETELQIYELLTEQKKLCSIALDFDLH